MIVCNSSWLGQGVLTLKLVIVWQIAFLIMCMVNEHVSGPAMCSRPVGALYVGSGSDTKLAFGLTILRARFGMLHLSA